jgi:hypothetical protein
MSFDPENVRMWTSNGFEVGRASNKPDGDQVPSGGIGIEQPMFVRYEDYAQLRALYNGKSAAEKSPNLE